MKYLFTLLSLTFFMSVFAAEKDAIIEGDLVNYPIKSNGGMVASQEFRASKVAANILKNGGNAIDAAVALGFAKAVTLPKAGNLGGGGFMLIYLAKEDKTIAIDYREMAPSQATEDMFLNDNGKASATKSRFTTLASGVPGTVAGLLHALEHYGTMKREVILEPSVKLAEQGIVADYPFLDSLNARKKRLINDKEVARIYFKSQGDSYQPGELIKFPDLAWSLKQIQQQGSDAFYKGSIADKFVEYMTKNQGLITKQDLANYEVKEREAVTGTYRGYKVVSMPPPSSGGVHVIQTLNILENFNLKDAGWGSAQHIHLLTEVFKRIYADRSKHLGDPDFYPVPMETLTSKSYAKQLAKKINLTEATPSSEISATEFSGNESPQTTHFSVIDRWGNIVTNTYTLNFSFGSGKIVDGTGIFLNNEMDDFSAKPGTPNAFGLIGGKANAVEPRKRPLSSMTPTFVLKDNIPVLITGSPGGSRIITTVLHQIINVIDFDLNISEAAHRPRFHHQWMPDRLLLEGGFSPDTIRLLQTMGHNVQPSRASGSVQSVGIDPSSKTFIGASDPRRSGAKTIGVLESGQLIEN